MQVRDLSDLVVETGSSLRSWYRASLQCIPITWRSASSSRNCGGSRIDVTEAQASSVHRPTGQFPPCQTSTAFIRHYSGAAMTMSAVTPSSQGPPTLKEYGTDSDGNTGWDVSKREREAAPATGTSKSASVNLSLRKKSPLMEKSASLAGAAVKHLQQSYTSDTKDRISWPPWRVYARESAYSRGADLGISEGWWGRALDPNSTGATVEAAWFALRLCTAFRAATLGAEPHPTSMAP